MKAITINGEQISITEAQKLIKMICTDAKQIAGEFHGMERSAKFRANWPDEDLFAESEWKNFVAAARAMYAHRLGDPATPPAEARKMHLALVLERMVAEGQEKDNRLQLMPDTQQFAGDKYENRKILENYGTRQNFRAALKNGIASLTKH